MRRPTARSTTSSALRSSGIPIWSGPWWPRVGPRSQGLASGATSAPSGVGTASAGSTARRGWGDPRQGRRRRIPGQRAAVRRVERPRDRRPGPARTFQLAQAMRELRFSRHCVAVQAAVIPRSKRSSPVRPHSRRRRSAGRSRTPPSTTLRRFATRSRPTPTVSTPPISTFSPPTNVSGSATSPRPPAPTSVDRLGPWPRRGAERDLRGQEPWDRGNHPPHRSHGPGTSAPPVAPTRGRTRPSGAGNGSG